MNDDAKFAKWAEQLRAEFAKHGPAWATYGREIVVDQECWHDMFVGGMTPADAVEEEISAGGE